MQTYLPAFEACVSEGNVASFMCSLNAVNSVPSCANGLLQDSVAREQWGFSGFIVCKMITLIVSVTALQSTLCNSTG